jgi:hypothetical protein
MPKGIFLTMKDLAKLEGYANERVGWRLMRTLRDVFQKKEGQKITLQEYASYRGVDYSEISKTLNLKP